jgi:4-hydroxybenzoate polyprenyltransferase
MIAAVGYADGVRAPRLVLFALGVLAGELSIGWSNDAFDAPRDTAALRRDKPIATGAIGRRPVLVAAVLSVAAGIVLCFVLGPRTGLVNLVMMAAGWAYNMGLKATLASGLMYIVGFGLIPVLAASANPTRPYARPWAVIAAVLLGLGGHFANTLPDLAGDAATGVNGLPQRVAAALGDRAVRLVTFGLLLSASCVIVFGGHAPGWPMLTGGAAAVVLMLIGLRATGRWPFVAALGVAAIDVVLFAERAAG